MVQLIDLLSSLEPVLSASEFLKRIRKQIHASRDSALRGYCDVLSEDPCGPLRAASLPKDWSYENWIGRVRDLTLAASMEFESPGFNGMTCYEAGYASCLYFELVRIEWSAMESTDEAICAPVILAARQRLKFDDFVLYLAGTLRELAVHELTFGSHVPKKALAIAALTSARQDLRSLHVPCVAFLAAQEPDMKSRLRVQVAASQRPLWRAMFETLPAAALQSLEEFLPKL